MKQNRRIATVEPSSFRDPSGFIFFSKNKDLYRQINSWYKANYDLLIKTGLYKKLTDQGLMVKHVEVKNSASHSKDSYKIIMPERIPFISYAYEWSFSMLKDAALLSLQIQKTSLEYGMSLKDASSFNIQFIHGKPILIDTLSFEKYKEGKPWVAYRQFCQHFLAPLALMAYTDIRMNQLFKIYLDGIPLDLASKLLPWSTHFNFGLLSHIHFHAISQKQWADKYDAVQKVNFNMSRMQSMALLDNLKSTVRKLTYPIIHTEWGNYYQNTNYDNEALHKKYKIVESIVTKMKPKTVWDLGANNGFFSRIASGHKAITIAFDIDPIAIEKNYLEIKKKQEQNLLPLQVDLINPTGSYGWMNAERKSLIERGPADMVFALALMHHLVIGANIPFSRLASFFASIGKLLVIEFVPKDDSQVQKLLSSREDIFTDYHKQGFEDAFKTEFMLLSRKPVRGTKRIIYLFKTK